MSKFSHIASQKISSNDRREYLLSQITVKDGISPILIVKPATEANKVYFNGILRSSAKLSRRAARGVITTDMLEQNRVADKILFPKYIIVGWQDMIDSDGNEVKFSQDACVEFLEALDDWIFDDIRNFCSDQTNFQKESIDIDSTVKN